MLRLTSLDLCKQREGGPSTKSISKTAASARLVSCKDDDQQNPKCVSTGKNKPGEITGQSDGDCSLLQVMKKLKTRLKGFFVLVYWRD